MLNNKTIAVVVPAYNEETQIAVVIKTMPDFVDRIIVVDDCSTDNTREIVKELITTAKGVKGQRIPKAAEQIQEDFFNRAEVVALEIRKEMPRSCKNTGSIMIMTQIESFYWGIKSTVK
jgi:glycosyltransferase involved in cell wall biosynthesis